MSKVFCPLCNAQAVDCKCTVGELLQYQAKILNREFKKVNDQIARYEKALRLIAIDGCEFTPEEPCRERYPHQTTNPCGSCRAAITLEEVEIG